MNTKTLILCLIALVWVQRTFALNFAPIERNYATSGLTVSGNPHTTSSRSKGIYASRNITITNNTGSTIASSRVTYRFKNNADANFSTLNFSTTSVGTSWSNAETLTLVAPNIANATLPGSGVGSFAGSGTAHIELWIDGYPGGEKVLSIIFSGEVTINSTGTNNNSTPNWTKLSGDDFQADVSSATVYADNISESLSLVGWTPPTVDGNIDLSGSEGGKVGLYVDLDGDGLVEDSEKVGEYEMAADGSFSAPYDSAWDGKKYQYRLEKLFYGNTDGPLLEVPRNDLLTSGTFESGATVEIGNEVNGGGTIEHVQGTSVDAQGNRINTTITRSTISVDGNSSVSYTYQNSSGGHTTQTFINGNEAAKSSDIQRSQVQNSSENEAILAKLGEIAENTAPSPSPTPAENASVSDIEDAAASALSLINTDIDLTGLSVSGVLSPTATVTSADEWNIPIPTSMGGGSININPLANADIAAFAPWFRNLLILIITAFVIFRAYWFLFTYEGYSTLQPFGTTLGVKANIEAWIAAASATYGLAGAILATLAFIIFGVLASLVVTTILGAILSLPSLLSGYFSWTAYGGSTVNFPLGGHGIMDSIWVHLQSAPVIVLRSISLIDKFIPLAHLLVSLANALTMTTLGTYLLRVAATIKRRVPS